jgi:peptidoglycan/xylan/chitin deacetylase (PgdA/CDA1 family)
VKTESYVTRFAQVPGGGVRSFARARALSILSTYYHYRGIREKAFKRNRVQFLYLHHVLEDEENAFRALIINLMKQHKILSHSQALRILQSGKIDKPYVSFSFDDGLGSCFAAAKILNEYGISACFYVVPSVVGLKNFEEISRRCISFGLPPMELLSWEDISSLIKMGHEIGCHTLSHADLGTIDAHKLRDEICIATNILTQKIGKISHFAWPFGRFRNFSPAAAKLVFESGYSSCASGVRGCHAYKPVGPPKMLCIRRDHVIENWPLDHTLYFIARSSMKASISDNLWPDGWSDKIGSPSK